MGLCRVSGTQDCEYLSLRIISHTVIGSDIPLLTLLLAFHALQAFQQAEQVLRILAGGLSGRLHPLHARVIDAITPLLNISVRGSCVVDVLTFRRGVSHALLPLLPPHHLQQIQRGDSVAVFNLALQLWEAERAVVDLPTLSQLTYLSALVDAAQYKVCA